MIKNWLIKIIAGKFVGGWIASLYKKLEGWKTPISIVLCIAVGAAQYMGYINESLATQLYGIVGTGGTMALFEKINRYKAVYEKVEEDVKEGSK